ncbi:sugar transferase [soil metagenome]
MAIDLIAEERLAATGTRRRRYASSPEWERRYVAVLVASDLLAALLAVTAAMVVRFWTLAPGFSLPAVPVSWVVVALGVSLTWVVLVALCRGYQPAVLGFGTEEFRRVLRACLRGVALVGLVLYAVRSDLPRGFIAIVAVLVPTLSLLGRWLARRVLHRKRAHGHAVRQVVVVGSADAVATLVQHFGRNAYAGYQVAGVCCPEPLDQLDTPSGPVPVYGPPDLLLDVLAATGADVLAVAEGANLGAKELRAAAWQLEGSGVELLLAPGLTEIAGPRIHIRPLEGLPLLQVEEPQLSGPARWAKELVERFVAAVAIVVLAPLLLAVALAVKCTSAGPVLFCQVRVGRDGQPFRMLKFRTMAVDAEELLCDLTDHNESDGLLFKVRQDPRITRVGRLLRRFSIDEVPQLWHVVTGAMSMVGPRPPLPSEVARYDGDLRRRLVVKPGLTGLWQVSGRSDLPWEDAVRLDLYYVDNWSPTLDLLILAKTADAIIRGRGAY